jgi:uncharacterized protein (TIGR02271 family)
VAGYVLHDQAPLEAQASPRPAASGEVVARIPLVAERLVAQIRRIQRGIVRLHKAVLTEEQVLTVSLAQEEALVERIPAEQFDADAPLAPDETIIPVIEERLVVEKRRVITEYLRVRKRVVTHEHEVREQVRREVITVTEHYDDAAPPVHPPPMHEQP